MKSHKQEGQKKAKASGRLSIRAACIAIFVSMILIRYAQTGHRDIRRLVQWRYVLLIVDGGEEPWRLERQTGGLRKRWLASVSRFASSSSSRA